MVHFLNILTCRFTFPCEVDGNTAFKKVLVTHHVLFGGRASHTALVVKCGAKLTPSWPLINSRILKPYANIHRKSRVGGKQ